MSWYGLFLSLLIIDGVLLAVIVLLQSGKGGGLAAMGGAGGTAADALIGGRQAATLLTKATWIAGGLFLVLAMSLSVLSSRRAAPESILRSEQQRLPAPQPLLPGTEPSSPQGGTAPASQPPGTGAEQQPTGPSQPQR